jgi:hypothetical protein
MGLKLTSEQPMLQEIRWNDGGSRHHADPGEERSVRWPAVGGCGRFRRTPLPVTPYARVLPTIAQWVQPNDLPAGSIKSDPWIGATP